MGLGPLLLPVEGFFGAAGTDAVEGVAVAGDVVAIAVVGFDADKMD